jgi:hypothetical protein
MRMPALILTVMAATLLIAPASPQQKANPPLEELPSPDARPQAKEQKEGPAKTVKELQKERIATLKEMVEQISEQFKNPRLHVSFDELLEARLLLLKAELDAAEKESDRINLYKSTIAELKKYEEWADGRVKMARGTVATVLKIKARRLEAEIDLARAKAKVAK